MQHLTLQHLSISAISQLLLNFDQLLKVVFRGHVYQMPNVKGPLGHNIFWGLNLFDPKEIWTQFFRTKILVHQIFLDPNIFGSKIAFTQFFKNVTVSLHVIQNTPHLTTVVRSYTICLSDYLFFSWKDYY